MRTSRVVVVLLAALCLPGATPTTYAAVPSRTTMPTITLAKHPRPPQAPNVRTFRVLRPDGTPAAGAMAYSWLLRSGTHPGRPHPYVSVADATGTVRAVIPAADPVIAAHPRQRMFNALTVVVDTAPGRVASAPPIPFILNLGDPRWPVDPTSVEGAVLHLAPHADGALAASPALAADDTCTPLPSGGAVCEETTWPYELRSIPVTVAGNFGAGTDFVTSVDYRNSQATITSTLTGTDGTFVEVQQSNTLETNDALAVHGSRSGVAGGTSDETLRIATRHKVVTATIYAGLSTFKSTVHGADRMEGPASTVSGSSYHDQMNETAAKLDCGNFVDHDTAWTNTTGTTKSLEYSIGIDVNGQLKAFNLHATTRYDHYNEVIHTSSVSWRVKSSPQYPFHYVFVPNGMADYDETLPGGGPAACPARNPGGVYTHASIRPDLTPDAPGYPVVTAPPSVTEPTEEVKSTARRCEAAPERCGQ